MNSREKGKRGERQWRDELRANGYHARRGQQFCGLDGSADVVCNELDWIHFEVKAVERLNIESAMEQARRDGVGKTPVVAHRRNRRPWLVTIRSDFFFGLLRAFDPAVLTQRRQGGETLTAKNANHTNRKDSDATPEPTGGTPVPPPIIFRRDVEKDPRDAGATTKQNNAK